MLQFQQNNPCTFRVAICLGPAQVTTPFCSRTWLLRCYTHKLNDHPWKVSISYFAGMTLRVLLVFFFWAAIAVLSLKNGYTSHFMRGLVNFPPFPRFSVFLYAKVPIQAYVRTLASPKCSSFPPQEVRPAIKNQPVKPLFNSCCIGWSTSCKDQKNYRYTSLETITLLPTHKEHGYEYPVWQHFSLTAMLNGYNEYPLTTNNFFSQSPSFSLSKIVM